MGRFWWRVKRNVVAVGIIAGELWRLRGRVRPAFPEDQHQIAEQRRATWLMHNETYRVEAVLTTFDFNTGSAHEVARRFRSLGQEFGWSTVTNHDAHLLHEGLGPRFAVSEVYEGGTAYLGGNRAFSEASVTFVRLRHELYQAQVTLFPSKTFQEDYRQVCCTFPFRPIRWLDLQFYANGSTRSQRANGLARGLRWAFFRPWALENDLKTAAAMFMNRIFGSWPVVGQPILVHRYRAVRTRSPFWKTVLPSYPSQRFVDPEGDFEIVESTRFIDNLRVFYVGTQPFRDRIGRLREVLAFDSFHRNAISLYDETIHALQEVEAWRRRSRVERLFGNTRITKTLSQLAFRQQALSALRRSDLFAGDTGASFVVEPAGSNRAKRFNYLWLKGEVARYYQEISKPIFNSARSLAHRLERDDEVRFFRRTTLLLALISLFAFLAAIGQCVGAFKAELGLSSNDAPISQPF